MRNAIVLFIIVFYLAPFGRAQGPPVRIDQIQAEQSLKLSKIPIPGEEFDLEAHAPKAFRSTARVQQVTFPDSKLGKARDVELVLSFDNGKLHAVSAHTENRKSSQKLYKQMAKQFGDPYKLKLKEPTESISWSIEEPRGLIVRLKHNIETQHSWADLLLAE